MQYKKILLIGFIGLFLVGCDEDEKVIGSWNIEKSKPKIYSSKEYFYQAINYNTLDKRDSLEFVCNNRAGHSTVWFYLKMGLRDVQDFVREEKLVTLNFKQDSGDILKTEWKFRGEGMLLNNNYFKQFIHLLNTNDSINTMLEHNGKTYQFTFDTRRSLDALERVLDDCQYVK